MNRTLKILGWIICISTLWGMLFKIMHWPGASLLLMFASFLLIFFYLPIWLSDELKISKWKFYTWSQYLILTIWTVTWVFKFMHWPGAGILYFLFPIILFLFFFPVFLIQLGKAKKKGIKINMHYPFLFIILILHIWFFASTNVSKSVVASILQSSDQIERNYESVSKKNKLLYSSMEEVLDNKTKTENIYYKKAIELRAFTSIIDKHIRGIKSLLISKIDGITIEQADSLNTSMTGDRLNSDIPSKLICYDQNGAIGKNLKIQIELFKDSVIKYAPEDKRNFIKEGLQLDTDDGWDVDNEEIIPWINYYFDNVPLTSVLFTLTNYQIEVKYAEQQILTELYNQALVKQSDNIAAKLTEYGMKYENEKKQKEIELLKKDKEMNDIILQAKNDELKGQEQTIVFFVFCLFLAGVLVFYIIRSNIQRKKANKLLENQKHQIEIQKQEITDSISYAKRLQTAILPDEKEINSHLPNSFVLYQPKDIVSGDFYFFKHKNNSSYIAAADCTGHGVPGAFMSVVCSEKLNQAVTEKNTPNEILNLLNQLVKHTLKQTNADTSTRDGMDVCLCKIEGNKVSYSGANRPLWIIKNGSNSVEEIKATKVAIGGYTEDNQIFQESSLELQTGDTIYLLSDGYADQFGGEQAKKLTTKRMKELLLSINKKQLSEQRNELANFMEKWKGSNEQVDDILVIGIKF